MRLVFINRFFHPDESATALMLADLVVGLAPLGLPMHVITAAAAYTPNAASATNDFPLSKITVTRLPSLPLSHHSLTGRLLNFAAFYFALIVVGLWHVRRGDIVICLTDPPLVGVFAALLTKLKRAQLIHWVQDIYPEVAVRLGFGSPANPAIRMAAKLRDRAWKSASANVVIGERMREKLKEHGVLPHQLNIIQNWADNDELTPLNPADNQLRSQWGFSDDALVVGYSGNLGRAHDVATMLNAATILKDRQVQPVRFLFIGGGVKHAAVESAIADEGGSHSFELRPYRARSELRQSLSVPDIHWLSLEPELEGLIVPSKFYGAAAVGRPIIFIGDPNGEVARLVKMADCGASFAKGDAEGVADYVESLAQSAALRHRLGANARQYSLAHLARDHRLAQWRALVNAVAIEDRTPVHSPVHERIG